MASTAYSSEIVLFEHAGVTDPVAEGWSASGSSGLGSAVIHDEGTGCSAWRVNDDSTSLNLLYIATLSASDVTDMNTYGWILSTTFRVTDTNNPPDLSRYVDYVDAINEVRWGLDFGSTIDGNVVVSLRGSALSYTLDDGDYHTFSLVYDPVAISASLFIDGADTAVLTGYTGMTATGVTTPVVRWGALSSSSMGSANYNEVSFRSW